jgi:hypothetical protein
MAVIGSRAIEPEKVKIRWKEPFLTSGLNRKAMATNVRGLYRGLIATEQPAPSLAIDLNPEDAQTGTGDSMTPASGGIQIIEDTSGVFNAENVGQTITISGETTNPGVNNGNFVVKQFLDSEHLGIDNSAGLLGTSFSWSLPTKTGDSIAIVEDAVDGYTTTVRSSGVETVTLTGLGLPLSVAAGASGTGDSITVLANGFAQIDSALGTPAVWSAADEGRYLTIAGETNPGNNGTFLITSVPGATQMIYYNPNAVGVAGPTEAFSYAVTHRFWVIMDVDYRQGVDTTAVFEMVDDGADLGARPQALRICRVDLPTDATTILNAYISQVGPDDLPDPDITTRPWGGTSGFGFSNIANQPAAIKAREDFTSLGAVTEVQLTGKWYVGRGATGTAKANFMFVQNFGTPVDTEVPILGTVREELLIDFIRNPITAVQVVPNLDTEVDSDGFIENPIVVGNFAGVTDSDFSTFPDISVVGFKRDLKGTITPEEMVEDRVKGYLQVANSTPIRNDSFITLPSVFSVQSALNNIDTRLTASRRDVVTVGPTGSTANFTGNDDTPFTAALADLGSDGGTILVMAGTYTFTTVVTVSTDNVIIKGVTSGQNAADTNGNGATSNVIIELDNTYRGQSGGGGVFFVTGENCRFEDILFRDRGTVGPTVYQAFIHNEFNLAGVGDRRVGFKVHRCSFSNNDGAGTETRTYIGCDGVGDIDRVDQVEISNCFFQSSFAHHCIHLENAGDVLISDNIAEFDSGSAQSGAFIFLESAVGDHHWMVRSNIVKGHITGTGQFIGCRPQHTVTSTCNITIRDNSVINVDGAWTSFGGMLDLNYGNFTSTNALNACTYVLNNTIDCGGAIGSTGKILSRNNEGLGALSEERMVISGNRFLGRSTIPPLYRVNSDRLIISENELIGQMGQWITTLPLQQPGDIRFVNNHCRLIGSPDGEFKFDPQGSAFVRGNTFDRSGLSGISAEPIRISFNTTFTDNKLIWTLSIFSGGVTSMLRIQGDGCKVTNNDFSDFTTVSATGGTGIDVQGVGEEECLITGNSMVGNNTCIDFGTNVIERFMIANNVMIFCQAGILAEDMDGSVVAGNLINLGTSDNTLTGTRGLHVRKHNVISGNWIGGYDSSSPVVTSTPRPIITLDGAENLVTGNTIGYSTAASVGIDVPDGSFGDHDSQVITGNMFADIGDNNDGFPHPSGGGTASGTIPGVKFNSNFRHSVTGNMFTRLGTRSIPVVGNPNSSVGVGVHLGDAGINGSLTQTVVTGNILSDIRPGSGIPADANEGNEAMVDCNDRVDILVVGNRVRSSASLVNDPPAGADREFGTTSTVIPGVNLT